MAKKTDSKAAAPRTAAPQKNKPAPNPTVEAAAADAVAIVEGGKADDPAPDGKLNVETVAAPKKAAAKTVELADKDTGFWDAETEFQVIRDERCELTEPIGTATQTAMQSGRLLIVN